MSHDVVRKTRIAVAAMLDLADELEGTRIDVPPRLLPLEIRSYAESLEHHYMHADTDTAAGIDPNWRPIYSPWRHGGWYVDNVHYPSGAVGCVSRNYPDHKWRIVCDPRPESYPGGNDDHTYVNRDAAARAELTLVLEMTA
jgi:hypothetical protein